MGLFFRAQGANIITVVVLFISLLTLFSILQVNFNPVVNKHVQKVVTVESFEDSDSPESLCVQYADKPHKIHQKCRELSEAACNIPSCCVWLNGKRCVGGGTRGPTFHTENGEDIEVDYFHLKNKCRGKCPN